MQLGVFSCIFTRMGASDNLQLGRSTFLEELSEAATILNAADQRSLVVMVCEAACGADTQQPHRTNWGGARRHKTGLQWPWPRCSGWCSTTAASRCL